MAFDLYVTFSGLCLLKRLREADGAVSELRVLMPPTGGHGGGAHVHRHVAVIGSHVRYQPGKVSAPRARFHDVPLGGGDVRLDLLSDDLLETTIPACMKLFNVSRVTQKPANHQNAPQQVVLTRGSVCPPSVCEHDRGARWRVQVHGQEERTHMATVVNWRVRGVRNQVDGRDGLNLPFTNADGTANSLLLRPVGGQIRMYFFHTPDDERPSKPPVAPVKHQRNTPNPHFRAFYRLFDGPASQPDPFFEDDGDRCGGTLLLNRKAKFNFYGRRVTCVVGDTDP